MFLGNSFFFSRRMRLARIRKRDLFLRISLLCTRLLEQSLSQVDALAHRVRGGGDLIRS